MRQDDFINQVKPIIDKVAEDLGLSDIAKTTCLVQAIHETGHGNSLLMIKANALFGIKATKTWKSKVYSSKTKEVYSGIEQTVSAVFRAYDSVEDSVRDYFKLLQTKRYNGCLSETSVPDMLHAIASAGYATDTDYVHKCISIYNTLIKADKTSHEESQDDVINRLAHEVIQGKYGNSAERKKRLGDLYAVVQHRVNILLRGGK